MIDKAFEEINKVTCQKILIVKQYNKEVMSWMKNPNSLTVEDLENLIGLLEMPTELWVDRCMIQRNVAK